MNRQLEITIRQNSFLARMPPYPAFALKKIKKILAVTLLSLPKTY